MQKLFKNALIGLFVSAFILLVSSAPAGAQVLAGSGDVAGYAGFIYVSNFSNTITTSCDPSCPATTDDHGMYGANGGFSPVPYITILGDFSYVPLYSADGLSAKTELYGGGARFNLNPRSRVVGYGLFTVGGDHLTLAASGGSSASASGYSLGLGGGASCYIGHNWGVRPEFRYLRLDYSSNGASQSFNSIAMTGGVFFQFGGHGGPRR